MRNMADKSPSKNLTRNATHSRKMSFYESEVINTQSSEVSSSCEYRSSQSEASCEGSEDGETGEGRSDGIMDRSCLRESEQELEISEHDKTSSKSSFICSGDSEVKRLGNKIRFYPNLNTENPKSD